MTAADPDRRGEADEVVGLPGGWRAGLESFAAGTLIALAVGTVDALSRASDLARAGRPTPLWVVFGEDGTSILMVILLLPAVFRFLRRYPLRAWPNLRWVAPHVAGLLAFSLAHVLGMGILRWLILTPLGSPHDPFSPLVDWPYELRKDALSYLAIIAFATSYWAWRRPVTTPAATVAEDEPIEVRDGARRFFVRPSDILWVEAAGNYAELHLAARSILQRVSLSSLEERLGPLGFARIHRARLVNRAEVAGLETNAAGDFTVTLRDGRTLAGSRRYRATLSQPADA